MEKVTQLNRNPFTEAEGWRPPRRLAEKSLSSTKYALCAREAQSSGTAWTTETLVAELRSRGLQVIEKRNGYWAQCPCPEHDDHNPSLQIRTGSVAVIVKCHSRCSQANVLKAIGPPPGWTAQPYGVQLPERHDEMLCLCHRIGLECRLEEKGENLTPALMADLVRWLHREQRQRIKRIAAVPRACPRAQRHFVLLGDFSEVPVGERVALIEAAPAEREAEEAMLLLPARTGRVMKLVLDDLVLMTNARLTADDTRAVPYASRTVADRLGEDDRQVRKALERLRNHGLIVRVGELPGRWDDGTPLYALAVLAPCPLCSRDVEGAAPVVGLDAQHPAAASDGHVTVKPVMEHREVADVAVAERHELGSATLTAAERGTGMGIGVGHADERYAEPRLPFDPDVCPFS
ncbi:MAG: hypothetical protein WKF96_12305 [Solirubrobacteraceae bacterium]